MDDQLLTIQELIDSATSSLKTARNMLSEFTGIADPSKLKHAAQASIQSSASVSDGKVIEGIDVLDVIANSETGTMDKPVEDITFSAKAL